MKNILVTGGAGYIGSHTVKELVRQKYNVVVYDNLSSGHKWAVKSPVKLVVGDLLDTKKLERTIKANKIEAVIHFAGFIEVGESVENPQKYYINNVVGSLSLFDAMVSSGVKKIVFSSSAAVYGNPKRIPIKEEDPKEPTNPYGQTKKIVETILKDYFPAFGLSSVSLRYFNAAGAELEASIGEAHDPETHLVPRVLSAFKKNEPIYVYGDNYKTKDGTCLRDYIHVDDLADAHVKALLYLQKNQGNYAFNLGSGEGFSVKEIIDVAEKVTGEKTKVVVNKRRSGDPDCLLADISKAKKELGWSPTKRNLENIISTAWVWEQNRK